MNTHSTNKLTSWPSDLDLWTSECLAPMLLDVLQRLPRLKLQSPHYSAMGIMTFALKATPVSYSW